MSWKPKDRISIKYGFEGTDKWFYIAFGAGADETEQALDLVCGALVKCPSDIAALAVTTLHLRTKTRKEDGSDMEGRIKVFARDLEVYPPDVVVEACKSIAAKSTFFPAWAEVQKECDRLVSPRQNLRAALERSKVAEAPRTEASGPKGENVRLKDEYERLGEPWPGYDKASWVFIVGIGDEIGEKNE